MRDAASLVLRLLVAYLGIFVGLVIAFAAAGAMSASAAGLLAAAVGATFMASAVALALAGRTLRRVEKALSAFAAGDFERRVAGAGQARGALNSLSAAVNRMGSSLQEREELTTQERNRLIAVLNSSADAVLAVDGQGHISFANGAAERLLDWPDGEGLVRKRLAWVLSDDSVISALRRSQEKERSETCMIELPNRQHFQVLTAPIIGGGEWAALVVFHDVTDVKQTEELRRDLVANISHELRTPLASLKSVMDTLQGGALSDPAAAPDFLGRAETEVDRLIQIVEKLLALSRIESGRLPLRREPVRMGQIVLSAVERLRSQAERKSLELSVNGPDDLPGVPGDAEQLEQVVVNLLHNAIKFTPEGGSIDVSAMQDNGAVRVAVKDTGPGIPTEEIPRLFERFYKKDRARGSAGTGLGLAIVKHTVKAHGGTVGVESEPERGSTFTFTLPVPNEETT